MSYRESAWSLSRMDRNYCYHACGNDVTRGLLSYLEDLSAGVRELRRTSLLLHPILRGHERVLVIDQNDRADGKLFE